MNRVDDHLFACHPTLVFGTWSRWEVPNPIEVKSSHDTFHDWTRGQWHAQGISTSLDGCGEMSITHMYCVAPLLLRGWYLYCHDTPHDQKGLVRLAPKTQISKLRLAHLDFNRKLNSKPDLFSSIFWFEHSFRCKNAILFFALFTWEKCPKINKIEIWPKSG